MHLINFTYSEVLIAIFALLLSYVCFKIYRFYTYWSRHGVKGPNAFVSMYRLFTKQWHQSDYELSQKYGSIFGFYELFNKSIIINEPDIIRDIMVKDFDTFPNHRNAHFGELFNLNLFSLPGNEDWKRIRSIISPSFTTGKLKIMTDSIEELADKFCENLYKESRNIFDIRRYTGAFAMDVITCCAYGVKTNTISEPNHPMLIHARNTLSLDTTIPILIGFLAPKIAKLFNISGIDLKAIDFFSKLTDKIVNERKKQNSNSIPKNDFIQLMLNATKGYHDDNNNSSTKQNYSLSQNELTAQGVLFFIAGFDTTSNTLNHCFYYLSHHTVCQDKLFEEVSQLDEITGETLAPLKYLNAVISETLRLAPTVHRVEREAVKDYKLGDTGITIEKGTTVSFSAYTIQRDPRYFVNPDDFKPERFITDSQERSFHPYAYFPFGGGQRSCVGTRFAMNEMRMCLAKAIKMFRFLPAQQELKFRTAKLILIAEEVLVSVEKR